MAWRTAGKVGWGGGPLILFFRPCCCEAAMLKEGIRHDLNRIYCFHLSQLPEMLRRQLKYSRYAWNLSGAQKALWVNGAGSPWPVGVMSLKKRGISPVGQLFLETAREVVKSLHRPTTE
jgi:hypothetical protein